MTVDTEFPNALPSPGGLKQYLADIEEEHRRDAIARERSYLWRALTEAAKKPDERGGITVYIPATIISRQSGLEEHSSITNMLRLELEAAGWLIEDVMVPMISRIDGAEIQVPRWRLTPAPVQF